MAGVLKIETIPYSKEENGIVERANKEVNRHLRNVIFDTRVIENWIVTARGYLDQLFKIQNDVIDADIARSYKSSSN